MQSLDEIFVISKIIGQGFDYFFGDHLIEFENHERCANRDSIV